MIPPLTINNINFFCFKGCNSFIENRILIHINRFYETIHPIIYELEMRKCYIDIVCPNIDTELLNLLLNRNNSFCKINIITNMQLFKLNNCKKYNIIITDDSLNIIKKGKQITKILYNNSIIIAPIKMFDLEKLNQLQITFKQYAYWLNRISKNNLTMNSTCYMYLSYKQNKEKIKIEDYVPIYFEEEWKNKLKLYKDIEEKFMNKIKNTSTELILNKINNYNTFSEIFERLQKENSKLIFVDVVNQFLEDTNVLQDFESFILLHKNCLNNYTVYFNKQSKLINSNNILFNLMSELNLKNKIISCLTIPDKKNNYVLNIIPNINERHNRLFDILKFNKMNIETFFKFCNIICYKKSRSNMNEIKKSFIIPTKKEIKNNQILYVMLNSELKYDHMMAYIFIHLCSIYYKLGSTEFNKINRNYLKIEFNYSPLFKKAIKNNINPCDFNFQKDLLSLSKPGVICKFEGCLAFRQNKSYYIDCIRKKFTINNEKFILKKDYNLFPINLYGMYLGLRDNDHMFLVYYPFDLKILPTNIDENTKNKIKELIPENISLMTFDEIIQKLEICGDLIIKDKPEINNCCIYLNNNVFNNLNAMDIIGLSEIIELQNNINHHLYKKVQGNDIFTKINTNNEVTNI
jgi:hypothetical protein